MFVKLRRFSLAVTRWLRYSSGNSAKALAPTSAKFRILGVHSGHEPGDLRQRGRRGQQTDSDQQEEVLVDIGGEVPASLRAPDLCLLPFEERTPFLFRGDLAASGVERLPQPHPHVLRV